jgi:quercetin dioxygenase-like cupin family protein
MHIKSFHTEDKPLQTKNIFSATEGKVIAIQLAANATLKEHITTVPAFLICISGEVVFENEKGLSQTIANGDTINIEPNVKHWLIATSNSNLILIK